MKVKLSEITVLDQEINGVKTEHIFYPGLLGQKISFPLKFRLSTILSTQVEKAMKMILEERKRIAIANGAKEIQNGFEFEKTEGATSNHESSIKDIQGYKNFQNQYFEFLDDDNNSIEIDAGFKLSAFKNENDKVLHLEGHYKIIYKFIIDDLE